MRRRRELSWRQRSPGYSTFLGGTGYDAALAVAVDALGDVVATGFCGGPGFPSTPDAYDPTYNGGDDAFLVRLRPLGNGIADLVYGTFLGASDNDAAWLLALTPGGSAMDPVAVAGWTSSADFPTTCPLP